MTFLQVSRKNILDFFLKITRIRSIIPSIENIIIPMFSINTCKSIIRGDVNEDYLLNVIDITIIVNVLIEETTLSDKQFVITDMNEDSFLNVVDIIDIVNKILSN